MARGSLANHRKTPLEKRVTAGMRDLARFGETYTMSDNSAKWPADTFGIYLLLDRESGRISVGATARSFQARWRDHRCDLRAGRHRNPILQRAFNRDGEGAFVMMRVEALSVRDPKAIAERENHWIRELQSRVEEGGFNLKDGEAMSIFSSVTKELMRKIAYLRRGHQFRFKGPDGSIVDVPDLDAFCSNHGLNRDLMSEVFAGRRRSHRGWVRYDSDYVPRGHRAVTFISPKGKRHITANLTEFAKEHGLIPSCMIAVAHGKYTNHRGWTVDQAAPACEKRAQASYPSRVYEFKNPAGVAIRIADLTQFCRENQLDRQTMVAVFRGDKFSYRGYTRVDSDFVPKCCRSMTVVAPDGAEYCVTNLKTFAAEHGLTPMGLTQLKVGRIKTTGGGWRLKAA